MDRDEAARGVLRDTGSLVAGARREAGLTQEELGARMGLARSTISAVEQGSVNVSLLFLCRAAHALGVSTDEMLPYSARHYRPHAAHAEYLQLSFRKEDV